jgi:hypothetical protein
MTEKLEKQNHVLTASSNLLGICFVVLTSLKLLKLDGKTFVDECTVLATIMFMASSILSFLSIRSKTIRGEVYERIADIIFLIGLFALFITTMLVTFNIIK